MGVAVLASGGGTILQALIDARLPVDAVLADRSCEALKRAEHAGIPAVLVERKSYGRAFDRTAYSHEVVEALATFRPDVVAVAGFGTVVPEAATAFAGRMVNTHPSLLPAFKGWHPVRDALAFGVKVTGCTVHLVTEEVDAGPILAQECVLVRPDDSEQSLHERIKEVERRLYPATIKELLTR